MSAAAASRRDLAARVAATVVAASLLLAAVDAAAIAAWVPLPVPVTGGVGLRVAHHLYDAAETLGVGAVLAAALAVVVRFVPAHGRLLWAAAYAAVLGIVMVSLGDRMRTLSEHALDGRFARLIDVVGLLGASGAVAFAPLVVSDDARRPVVLKAHLAVAVVALALDQALFRDEFLDLHCFCAFGAALYGGVAIGPDLVRAGRALVTRLAGRMVVAAAAVFALFGLVHTPPNVVRVELFRQPCAIAPWLLATTVWQAPEPRGPVRLAPSPWLEDRSSAPDVAPSVPTLLPRDAVIVLITIDALRAEVLEQPGIEARFPTLAKLAHGGVVFTHASAPGTQTEVTLATFFSGRTSAELPWTDGGSGWMFAPHPITDTLPRLPSLLAAHGIATADYAGTPFLDTDYGVTRGFAEETRVLQRRGSAPAFKLVDAMVERLKGAGPGPLFLFAHLLDTHAPYARGTGPTAYERYLSTVAISDAQVGRVLHVLESFFGRRWALFVSADHGEAFGEHQTTEHGKTLYEELLHVPLIAYGPVFPACAVEERVGVVDLGPTILDLFGAPTPGDFEGQSLVPFLGGGTTQLTRPLVAEGRLRRALTRADGLKVIDDPRRKVVEVYDLTRDPGETTNLWTSEPARSDEALAELRAFFAVHTWRAPGYREPYKP